MATISESLLANGSYPVRVDQVINANSQIATAIYTYLDGSKVYGAYAYANAAAADYLAAAYNTLPVVTPVPTPPPTQVLSSFAVATNGLSITYNNSGNLLTAVTGTYAINNVSANLLLLSNGNFQTAQIKTGDVVTISIFTSVPATTAIATASVVNNSTFVPPVSAGGAVTPLSFASFNLGATAVGSKATITSTDLSMAVSAPILVADFREFQYVYKAFSVDGYAISLEANNAFTLGVNPGDSPFTETPLLIKYSFDRTLIYGASVNGSNVMLNVVQDTIAFNNIISVKKAANGLDLVFSKSVDGITFTPILTRVGAFRNITTFYIKVAKVGTYAGGTALTDVEILLK